MFPKKQYIFIFFILSLAFGCAYDPSGICQRGICETKVESGSQIFRFSFDGVNGILEKREIAGNDWVSGGEKPEMQGYVVAGVFGLNNNIFVSHCDASGNLRLLKFNSKEETWKSSRFETGGCF